MPAPVRVPVPAPVVEGLTAKARAAGLWHLFLPPGSAGLTNLEYAPIAEIAEIAGMSPWIMPEAMNGSAPSLARDWVAEARNPGSRRHGPQPGHTPGRDVRTGPHAAPRRWSRRGAQFGCGPPAANRAGCGT